MSVVTLKYIATNGLFPSCKVYQDKPEREGEGGRGREGGRGGGLRVVRRRYEEIKGGVK